MHKSIEKVDKKEESFRDLDLNKNILSQANYSNNMGSSFALTKLQKNPRNQIINKTFTNVIQAVNEDMNDSL